MCMKCMGVSYFEFDSTINNFVVIRNRKQKKSYRDSEKNMIAKFYQIVGTAQGDASENDKKIHNH